MSKGAIDRIITAAMDSRPIGGASPISLADVWPASSFGLDRCAAFTDAAPSRRNEILERCAMARLHEAWFIERLGITYGAKMTLQADSDEERTLYALICGEEAAHFRLISSLVSAPVEGSEFTALLECIVAEASKPALVYLVQVVLEGWGLRYYGRLERECLDPAVRASFAAILRDEARHHGSGVALTRSAVHDPAVLVELEGYLRQLLAMVRSGPQAVVAALQPQEEAESLALFTAIGGGKTRADLQVLRKLIDTPSLNGLVASLENDALFEPMTPAAMARVYARPSTAE